MKMKSFLTSLATLVGAGVLVGLLIFGIAIFFAYPVKWLWNDTMPVLFGLPVLSTFKAWEVLVLTGFLFRSSNAAKSK